MKPAIAARPTGLSPSLDIYPVDAAFMARPCASQISMLGLPSSVQDTVTLSMMGAFNGLPTVRHRAGATPQILDILANSGLMVEEDMRLFETPEEAERHAYDLIREGRRLVWPYPPEDGRFPSGSGLITPQLWKQLNSKQRLLEIAPRDAVAERQLVAVDELETLNLDKPVFLKAGGDAPTGSGFAVRRCESEADLKEAVSFYRSIETVSEIIVEEAVDVLATWCISLAIDEERVRFIGAAEQLFDAPAHQIGNIIDPANPLPVDGIKLAISIGERARQMGFRGAGGLDIGVTNDGRAVVFDPNFRIQASTQMVLFYEAAVERTGLRTCQSFTAKPNLTVQEIARRLHRPVEEGWFITTRIIDGALMTSLGSRSQVNGLLMGHCRQDVAHRQNQIKHILEV